MTTNGSCKHPLPGPVGIARVVPKHCEDGKGPLNWHFHAVLHNPQGLLLLLPLI